MKTVTLKTAKRILGKSASKFTDDELTSLINGMEVLAEIYIDTYGSKKQRGVPFVYYWNQFMLMKLLDFIRSQHISIGRKMFDFNY